MKLLVEKRALAMMNAAVIDGSDLSNVDVFAKKYDGKVSAKEKYKYVGRTVKERVKNFKRDNTGFSCSTDYKKESLSGSLSHMIKGGMQPLTERRLK